MTGAVGTGGREGAGPPSRTWRPVVGVWAALAVSVTGTRVSAIALPWFVLVTTGSAAQTGLVSFCEMAPYVAVKALAGPVVDRVGPRTVSMTADIVSASAAASLPLLHATGALTFGALLPLVALIGAARGPGDLAKHVLIPEAADQAAIPLERATGVGGVIERSASTVGPGVGGALIASMGAMSGLIVNAVAFALGSVVLALLAPRGRMSPAGHESAGPPAAGPPAAGSSAAEPDAAEPAGAEGPERGWAGYRRSYREGLRWLRGQPLILLIIIVVGVANLVDAAKASVLIPVWARHDGGGPALIGLLEMVLGASAIGGSLTATAIAHRMRRRPVFLVAFAVYGAPTCLVLAFGAPLPLICGVYVVGGFASGFLNPILGAISYERVPRRMLGRVGAIADSLAWAGIPLGGIAAGGLVGLVGITPALLVAGGVYLLATTLPGFRPEWREMDRGRGRAARPGTAVPAKEGGPGGGGAPAAAAEPSGGCGGEARTAADGPGR